MIKISYLSLFCLVFAACCHSPNSVTTPINPIQTQTHTATAVVTITPSSTETPRQTATLIEPTPTKEPQAPTQEAPLERVRINQDDPYTVDVEDGLDLQNITDEELAQVAPKFGKVFDFTRYGFEKGEITELQPMTEFIVIGEEKFLPYANQDGNAEMFWDLGSGEIVHAQISEYTDPNSGFKTRVILKTDNSWTREGTWWRLDEREEGITARMFNDYTFPLNYLKEHDPQRFYDTFEGQSIEASKQQNMSYAQLEATVNRIKTEFHKKVVQDTEEDLKVRFPTNKRLTIGDNQVDILIDAVYSSRYGQRGYYRDSFAFWDFLDYVPNDDNSMKIQARMDKDYTKQFYEVGKGVAPGASLFVGGWLQEVLRESTAGNVISQIGMNELGYRVYRSTTDVLSYAYCGVESINRYLQEVDRDLGSSYFKERVVPGEDVYYAWRVNKLKCNFQRRSSGN